jgi:hypothetical protein
VGIGNRGVPSNFAGAQIEGENPGLTMPMKRKSTSNYTEGHCIPHSPGVGTGMRNVRSISYFELHHHSLQLIGKLGKIYSGGLSMSYALRGLTRGLIHAGNIIADLFAGSR